ncbi:hypothetical protein [Roseimicrobium sp. ORNL1]|uniref:hypothetical protein n=1 Tax=Roseimicrobium sp. ORNL1 TaxID=2711231 RepID=UPI00197D958E|nr:hypothetical protein [Roseimicrobium sp. ORNL1]
MTTERLSPGEYERRYADACVKADVVPAPVMAPALSEEDGEDEPESAVAPVHLRGFCRKSVRGARGRRVRKL